MNIQDHPARTPLITVEEIPHDVQSSLDSWARTISRATSENIPGILREAAKELFPLVTHRNGKLSCPTLHQSVGDALYFMGANAGIEADEVQKLIGEGKAAERDILRPAGDHSAARPVRTALSDDIVTEDNAALQFVAQYGHDLRYCHDTGAWFHFNGVIWLKDQTSRAFQYARELVRQLGQDQDDRKRFITSKTAFAGGVEKYAKGDRTIAVTMEFWDRDLMLLGTPGGTVDLRTGKLRAGNRTDGITKTTSVTPADTGSSPTLWLQFLKEATGNDAELIRFLQQFCGYTLTGSTREHVLMFIYGPGGNGKSVFLNVLTRIFSDYAKTSTMGTFAASKHDRHSTEIAMLRGARLVTASETEAGQSWAESRIKQMTGGDAITARFMRQDDFTFIPQFTPIIAGNNKPALNNVDEAMRRRFLLVNFEHTPAAPDRDLENKLMAEAAAILRWMIEGCLEWQRSGGLVKPASVQAATEEYFSDQDLFAHWLAEDCDWEPGNLDKSEPSSVMFKSWKDFALSAGHPPGTRQTFADQMKHHRILYKRGRRAREYFGIRLRPRASIGRHDG